MLRAGFFSTAYHPPCSLRASGMSFEGSCHSVPLGSPMNRAPPLAVSLFLPPVLPKSLLSKRAVSNLSSAIVWRFVVGGAWWASSDKRAKRFPRARPIRSLRVGTAGEVQRQVPYRNKSVNGNPSRD